MERIEVNVKTGKRTVVALTAQEIADAVANTAAEAGRNQAADARKNARLQRMRGLFTTAQAKFIEDELLRA